VKKVALAVVIVLLVTAVATCVGVIGELHFTAAAVVLLTHMSVFSVHYNRASKINTETMAATTNVSVSVPTYPNNVAQCAEDWELHGTKCYYFSPRSAKLPWKESRKMCQRLKGDLVKIESREEQDKFWIGLTDSETEGQWVWTDGSPLNSSLAFWADDDYNKEPDNWTVEDPEGEDCVRMGPKAPFIGSLKWWYDGSCKKEQQSICEKTAKKL
uniref:C-type lectin domain-containing protein n=1 Tax=Neogobius melanostomus TaxID=47308 RepID=A0A8C6T733_9GOBI